MQRSIFSVPATHWICLVCWSIAVLWGRAATADADRPNVILIMTDNHGAWTLGCYGNRDIRTPHIDRLARRGTLFENCFSCNPVCSPTRASWLTGLMPSQHGVHCYIAPWVQMGPRAFRTLDGIRSLPEILSDAGYVCGLSGKWHLGQNMEPQEGFTFWVTKPGGSTSEFYDQQVIESGQVRRVAEYQTDLWTRRGIEFIKANRQRPFFLFLAYNGPYGLSPMLLRRARNRHAAYYDTQQLPSFPRRPMHPWLYNNRDYLNNVVSMRRYAAEISGVDDGVGQIMETLRQLDLEGRTLVIFTADQGLAGGQGGVWGMGDHTRPLSAFDTTMHVPLVFHWPGQIAAGQRRSQLVSNYDFLPSILSELQLSDQLPGKPRRPGRDYSALLHGASPPTPWDDTVFYEFETVRAVRDREWKFVERIDGGPTELYRVTEDPEEIHNLADDSRWASQRHRLHERLQRFFATYRDPRYDLAHGGTSKAGFLHSKSKPVVRPSRRDARLRLDATTVILNGTQLRRTTDWRAIVGWSRPEDRARWALRGVTAGRYQVTVTFRGQPSASEDSSLPLTFDVDGKAVTGRWSAPRMTSDMPNTFRVHHSEPIPLRQGSHEVAVGLSVGDSPDSWSVVGVELTPMPESQRSPERTKPRQPEREQNTVGFEPADRRVLPVIESQDLRLVLRDDLKGVAKLIDKRTGRNLAAAEDRPLGLYCIYFGRGSSQKPFRLSSTSVVEKEFVRHADHLQLNFTHRDTCSATVTCRIFATADQPGIRWQIEVGNRSRQTIRTIAYPRLVVPSRDRNKEGTDRILIPQAEGVVLYRPGVNLPAAATVSGEYPGQASAQFVHWSDEASGLYCGCHDVEGFAKKYWVERTDDGILLTWHHLYSDVPLARQSVKYDLVWQASRPGWENGAAIYRQWARQFAPWCRPTARDTKVAWARTPVVFVGFRVPDEGPFADAEQADTRLRAYQEFLGRPVVATAFNWEQHGEKTGPDCFPPRGGDEYYRTLGEALADRGSHLQLNLPGFYWTMRRAAEPTANSGDDGKDQISNGYGRRRASRPDTVPIVAKQTNYVYEPQLFPQRRFRQSSQFAAVNSRGRCVIERHPWAENYVLCGGSDDAQKVVAENLQQAFALGVHGVAFDQTVGGGLADCFARRHDHPPGTGRWKYAAMSQFLQQLREDNVSLDADRFLGLGGPCDAYLPWVDVVRGRTFTDTAQPAIAPGATPVPMFQFLYHEFQPTYAGWIDASLSPRGDVRCGIGRAVICGMQLGVHIDAGPFELDSDHPSEELKMLRQAVHFQSQVPQYLLAGRMLMPPKIENAPTISPSARSAGAKRAAVPAPWPTVQCTAWSDGDRKYLYALANLSEKRTTVDVLAEAADPALVRAQLHKITSRGSHKLVDAVRIPARIRVTLAPWELCGLEMSPAPNRSPAAIE